MSYINRKCIKWIILLTTAINSYKYPNDKMRRINLYVKQINRYLKYTNYTIIVIESTGNIEILKGLINNEYVINGRIYFYGLKLDNINSATEGETKSIDYVLNMMIGDNIYDSFTHILKITGKYYLKDIENILSKLHDKDIYLQKHRSSKSKWQNSEYYGIKKEHFLDLINLSYSNIKNDLAFEKTLYEFSCKLDKIKFIGPFKNTHRKSTNKVIKYL